MHFAGLESLRVKQATSLLKVILRQQDESRTNNRPESTEAEATTVIKLAHLTVGYISDVLYL